jgi:hypothetical protein
LEIVKKPITLSKLLQIIKQHLSWISILLSCIELSDAEKRLS